MLTKAHANPHVKQAPSLETIGMTKRFGPLAALDDVSIKVPSGSFHALLGENGAGKSTLVKCIMGFYRADQGSLVLNGREVTVDNPKDALGHGIGMVYQHFTLVPSLTGAENLVISRADTPFVINWAEEKKRLEAFMDRMPFRVPLNTRVSQLAAGQKQKLEILKLLYLDQHCIILDEPTSVLTPSEADEMLTLLKGMAARGEITVIMITHKFREVTAFCDAVSILRRGQKVGGGKVGDLSSQEMARLMIGDVTLRESAPRKAVSRNEAVLELDQLTANDDTGSAVIEGVNLTVKAGEIVGIAGVSGNGQSALVEVLSGQRPLKSGDIRIHGKAFKPNRSDFDRFKVFGLPEEPLKNATVARMSVAENLALRTFDKAPISRLGVWMSSGPIRTRAQDLIGKYRVKTPSPDTPIENLSGGNIQRAVLARELSGNVEVLIVANPCFGLDFVSVAEIRAQIIEQRNKGAAVLLLSEDLDEGLELADRVAVMSEGKITYEVRRVDADRTSIGHHMAGH